MLLFVSLVACFKDERVDLPVPADGLIRIFVSTPSSIPPQPVTQSSQTAAESKIDDIQLLVFESGFYSYKVQGIAISQTESMAEFSARLRPNSVPTTIYIIANSSALVDANEPPDGTPIEDVSVLFSAAFTTQGISPNFGMWGSYSFPTGIGGDSQRVTDIIPLLRTVAKVDIQVAATASNFALETIQTFRASSSIQLIPNSPNTPLLVTTPSIPSGSLNNINTAPALTTSGTLSQSQVYLPESSAPATLDAQISDATCIVVGGRYNNSVDTRYYRLDFAPNINGYPLGQVLRNSHYLFTISKVNNDGHSSASNAAMDRSAGMEAEILVWPGDEIRYTFYNRSDYVGLSAIEVDLAGMINSSQQVTVSTSVSSYLLRFLTGTPSAWATTINNGDFSVSQINGGETLLITALRDNQANAGIRESIIQIGANDLQNVNIAIRQLPRMSIEWAKYNVDTFGVTTSELNARGLLYQWNSSIGWHDMNTRAPAGWPTAVVSRSPVWVQSNNPCPVGWRLPLEIEYRELVAENPGQREERSTNPLLGMWFCPTQAEANAATFANPGSCIFFPYSGRRQDNGTTVADNKINGFYWTQDVTVNANNEVTQINMFRMGQQFTTGVHRQNINREALAIRCVKEIN